MNGKLCCCPQQLVAIQKELHIKPEPLRCPNTGEFLGVDGWMRRFGIFPQRMTA